MSVNHYENFPVGSLVLPRRLRKPVHAVYAFARTADDIADEGEVADAVRLHRLD
ncbi:MAG TPA: squalene/phytoene synthase family protein, partial [Neisseria sp.]|nr:squalene/phytoene synthase family protein [Neisseria sp.]